MVEGVTGERGPNDHQESGEGGSGSASFVDLVEAISRPRRIKQVTTYLPPSLDDSLSWSEDERTVEDSPYTPSKRKRPKLVVEKAKDSVFLFVATQFEELLKQVRCRTRGCSGRLRTKKYRSHGLGGALEVDIFCSGCDQRFEYASSPRIQPLPSTMPTPAVSLAMQVAFICAGCTHAQYHKVLGLGLGMKKMSSATFQRTLKLMYPVVKSMIDEACEEAKAEMKAKDPSELGSWERAVTTADGCWLTRGLPQPKSYLFGTKLPHWCPLVLQTSMHEGKRQNCR